MLSDVYRSAGKEMPAATVMPEINVSLAFVSSKCGDYDLSLRALKIAFSQLEGKAGDLTKDERDYLRYYCALIYVDAVAKAEPSEVFDAPPSWPEKGDFNTEKVRSSLKKLYPIERT